MDRKWQLISTRARLEDRGWKPHATGPRLHCSNERAHPSVGGGYRAGLQASPQPPQTLGPAPINCWALGCGRAEWMLPVDRLAPKRDRVYGACSHLLSPRVT